MTYINEDTVQQAEEMLVLLKEATQKQDETPAAKMKRLMQVVEKMKVLHDTTAAELERTVKQAMGEHP